MPPVVFRKPYWHEILGRRFAISSALVSAGLIGGLLTAAFTQTNWIQILVVGIVPFLIYAMIKNTMMVFLIWIATTPILSNFVRVNLGAGIPDITVNRVAASLLMLTLLFQVAVKMRRFHRIVTVEWIMLGILLLLGISAARGYDVMQASQQAFDQIATPIIVFFLAKNLVTSEKEIRPLVWTLGVVTLYCAVLGFQEHFTERSLFTETGKLTWQQTDLPDRIQGPFDSPQVLGSVMVGGVVFFLYQLFNARSFIGRLLSLVIIVIHTFVTYWTYRRSVYLGYLATMLYLGIVEPRFRKALLTSAVISGLLLLASFDVISKTTVFEDRIANARTVNDRWVIWMTSWEIIKHFPVLGTGMNWFGEYYTKYFTFFGNTVTTDYAHGITSAHNSYIRLWVEGGIFLLIAYMLLLFHLMRRAWRLLRDKEAHPFAGKMEVMVFVGLFITQYVQALTTDLVFNGQYSAILIFLISGVLFQYPTAQRPVADVKRWRLAQAPT